MVVYEGKVITCDASGSVASWLVEDGSRIAYVGNELPERYAKAPRTALGARALLPAFSDTHLHFSSFALFSGTLDVRSSASIEQTQELVRGYVSERKPGIVLAFGASAHSVKEKRLLTREDLDQAAPDLPAMVIKYDGHASVVNSRMLALLPESLRALRGFNAESGQLFQEAYFKATDFATSRVSIPQLLSGMARAYDLMAGKGFGGMHTVEGVGFPGDMDVTLASLLAKGQRNAFRTKVWFQTMDESKAAARRLPRIGGCFATALDGCFGSADAAMLEPYSDDPGNKGILFYDDATLLGFFRRAHAKGLQIAVHAIGDAAFDQACRAFETILSESPRDDHRHTIIHACAPTPRGLETCARRGIHIAAQSAFLDWPLEPLEYLESILGRRARALIPLKDMLGAGIKVSLGSDAPCTLPDPIESLYCACNHPDPSQSVDAMSALRMLTANAAWAGFDEGETGSLEAGKSADLAILNMDPLSLPAAQLRKLKVESLILAGKPWKEGQSALSAIARALASPRRI